MYSKKTRVHCYAFTLLPALIGLVLWSTNPQTVFPLVVLFTPVLLALTLALCLHLTEKLEKDREKNKKINSVVIWIIPVLSNVTFWISYAVAVQRMEVPVLRILSWLFAAMYLVLGNYMPKCRPNSTVGIRVRWTASSDENWNATHRLAGPCYMACGFLMIPTSFLPEKAASACLIVLLVLGNAIPMVYSYVFYKKQQRQGVTFRPQPAWEGKVNKSVAAIGAAILVFVAVMLNWDSPLLPIHILWVNLITDSLPALALGMEPAEPDVMRRPPRDPKAAIFDRPLVFRLAYQGLLIALCTLAAYRVGCMASIACGQTMAFAVLSGSQIVHSFNLRSNTRSLFSRGPQNRWMFLAAGLAAVGAVCALPAGYLPLGGAHAHSVGCGYPPGAGAVGGGGGHEGAGLDRRTLAKNRVIFSHKKREPRASCNQDGRGSTVQTRPAGPFRRYLPVGTSLRNGSFLRAG